MPTYKIEYPISRHGKRIRSGTIDLDDAAEARSLMKVGAISPLDPPSNTPPQPEPDAGMAGDASGASPAPAAGDDVAVDEHTDQALDDRAHTLRAYLAGIKADGGKKPRAGDAEKATGIDDLSGAEIADAWRALA